MKANAPLWMVSLGQGGGDAAAVGGPDAPVITSQGTNVITFTAGGEGAAGPTLGYGASIEPEGPTVDVQVTDPSVGGQVVITDATPNTDYVVSIYGVNVAGKGKASATDPFQINWNVASGGDLQYEITDYQGTGETWKIHEFKNSGNFTVTTALPANEWNVLMVAGGGGGCGQQGNNAQGCVGGNGGAGGVIWSRDSGEILLANDTVYPISIGAGGSNMGGHGGNTTFAGLTATGGGGGGCGGGGQSGGSGGAGRNYCGNAGGPHGGGAGTAYQGHAGATGSGSQGAGASGGGANVYESGTGHKTGGRSVHVLNDAMTVAPGTSVGGGGGGGGWDNPGSPGQKGIVIIAYRVG